jgi:hypothetical protein
MKMESPQRATLDDTWKSLKAAQNVKTAVLGGTRRSLTLQVAPTRRSALLGNTSFLNLDHQMALSMDLLGRLLGTPWMGKRQHRRGCITRGSVGVGISVLACLAIKMLMCRCSLTLQAFKHSSMHTYFFHFWWPGWHR